MTPASIRNKNPGAMEPGPSSKTFGSSSFETLKWRGPDGTPRTNRIATFSTSEHGAAAMFDLLDRKYTGLALKDAVAKWCGGYWASEYAARVEEASGLKASDILTKDAIRDPAHAIPIAKAMARMEAGCDYPMDDAGWQSGHRMAFREVWAPAPSPDNDIPFPKPEAIARERSAEIQRKGWIATVIASSGGGAAHVATNGVPEPVKQGLSTATEWRSVGEQVADLGSFVVSKPFLSVPLVLAVIVLGWLVPAWAKKQEG